MRNVHPRAIVITSGLVIVAAGLAAAALWPSGGQGQGEDSPFVTFAAGLAGDGVQVDVIDTGIWPEHPSFDDTGDGIACSDPLPVCRLGDGDCIGLLDDDGVPTPWLVQDAHGSRIIGTARIPGYDDGSSLTANDGLALVQLDDKTFAFASTLPTWNDANAGAGPTPPGWQNVVFDVPLPGTPDPGDLTVTICAINRADDPWQSPLIKDGDFEVDAWDDPQTQTTLSGEGALSEDSAFTRVFTFNTNPLAGPLGITGGTFLNGDGLVQDAGGAFGFEMAVDRRLPTPPTVIILGQPIVPAGPEPTMDITGIADRGDQTEVFFDVNSPVLMEEPVFDVTIPGFVPFPFTLPKTFFPNHVVSGSFITPNLGDVQREQIQTELVDLQLVGAPSPAGQLLTGPPVVFNNPGNPDEPRIIIEVLNPTSSPVDLDPLTFSVGCFVDGEYKGYNNIPGQGDLPPGGRVRLLGEDPITILDGSPEDFLPVLGPQPDRSGLLGLARCDPPVADWRQ